jgi:hypothetical protein
MLTHGKESREVGMRLKRKGGIWNAECKDEDLGDVLALRAIAAWEEGEDLD